MTRGTFYLINDKMIIESVEFNGDMYPEGYGLSVVGMLEEIKTTNDFRNSIGKFNKENFNYDDVLLYPRAKDHYPTDVNGDIEMTDENYYEYFFSDWTFWKNISSEKVKIKTTDNKIIEIKPGGQVAINFGKAEYGYYKNTKECKSLISKSQ